MSRADLVRLVADDENHLIQRRRQNLTQGVSDQRLAVDRPEIRVLFMSGYTDDDIVRRGLLQPGAPFLQKPFVPADLSRKVRDVLDSR